MERDPNVARKFFVCESDDWNQTMLLKYPQMEQWRREKTCISYWCRVGRLECLSCYNRKLQVKQEVKQNTCSWCRNGCKNKKVYTSHSLKDNSGVITCPKLFVAIAEKLDTQWGSSAQNHQNQNIFSSLQNAPSTLIETTLNMVIQVVIVINSLYLRMTRMM